MLLYSAVSSPWDCSKCITFHPLADLFIPTPFRLLWEAFSNLQLLLGNYAFKYPHLSVARYSFIQLSEPLQRGMNEIAKDSK